MDVAVNVEIGTDHEVRLEPMSGDSCRALTERFVQTSLPAARRAAAHLAKHPSFKASMDRGRVRFRERDAPNWWQFRQRSGLNVATPEANAACRALATTAPFSYCIGKWIHLPIGGTRYDTPAAIASQLLIDYLFAAGAKRWRPACFERVWTEYLAYFDPRRPTLDYTLYVPMVSLAGIKRQLTLDDDWRIAHLPSTRVARLASRNPHLAGFTAQHRLTLWPTTFLVKSVSMTKTLTPSEAETPMGQSHVVQDLEAAIGEEAALLRSLLAPYPSLPSYGLVREGHPRDSHYVGGELPWRPRFPYFLSNTGPYPRSVLRAYAHRRARFLSLHGTRGWDVMLASMRRFAIAWQNPFPADTLADVVAAIESLVVRGETTEIGYKARVRTARLLATDDHETQRIIADIKDAYGYRSRLVHGDYVFDDPQHWTTARRLRRAKPKHGNPFHDANEIHRLTYQLADYYQRMVTHLIDRGALNINWTALGL